MACTRSAWFTFLFLSSASVVACGGGDDSEDIPAPPIREPGPKTEPDAGKRPTDMPDDDAGKAPPVEFEGHCDDVDVARFPASEAAMVRPLVNTTDMPMDYLVSRVEHRFDCDRDLLILTFGGGTCSRPKDPDLELTFDAQAIRRGGVSRGLVNIKPDSPSGGRSALSVRYTRSDSGVGGPAGVWGTCGSATGELNLLQTPLLTKGANYEGSYGMSLPPCDSTDADPSIVQGTFTLELAADMDQSCE